jgi:hypothetical protein
MRPSLFPTDESQLGGIKLPYHPNPAGAARDFCAKHFRAAPRRVSSRVEAKNRPMKRISCGDLIPSCAFKAQAATETEVLHVESDHARGRPESK